MYETIVYWTICWGLVDAIILILISSWLIRKQEKRKRLQIVNP